MKVCPQCGFRHIDTDERCIRCGAYLDVLGRGSRPSNTPTILPPSDPFADPPPPREKFKFTGAERPGWRPRLPGLIMAAFRRRLFFLRRALTSEIPTSVHYRNPWYSGALSLIPGLGQLYNHQPKKALLIFLFVGSCFGAALATLHKPWSNYILLGYLAAMLYSFHDGLVTAKKINREYFIWQHGIAFYCAWFFYVSFFCMVFQYAAVYFVMQFRTIAHDAMAPALRQGERVAVEMLSRHRVGDVVLYNPRPLMMEYTGELENTPVTLDPSSMIERIVAEPGQTFERHDGVYYRDGRPVPPGETPLVSANLGLNFKLTAPEDGYIVVYSYTFGKDWMTGMVAPRLNAPGLIVHNWADVCVVHPREITGRVWFVYQPPEGRRFLR